MRTVLAVFSLVLTFLLIPLREVNGDSPLALARRTLASTGVRLERAEIAVWGDVATPAGPQRGDLRLGRRMAWALGIRGPLSVERGPRTVRVSGRQGDLTFVLETVDLAQGIRETVFSAWRFTNRSPGEQDALSVAGPLEELGLHPEVAVDLVGSGPGDLRSGERSFLKNLFRNEGGSEQVGVMTGPAWFVAGLVPQGGPPVLVSGREVNLQVAVSYDKGSGATQITVGAPVISIHY